MATVKLSKDLREDIVRGVIGDKYKDAHGQLMVERAALGLTAYNLFYSKSLRNRMEALPEGWLGTRTKITVVVGEGSSNYTTINFSGYSSDAKQPINLVGTTHNSVSYRTLHKTGALQLQVEEGTKIAKAILSLASKEAVLVEEEEKRVHQEAWAVLSSVTTLAKLISIWPEVETVANKFIPVPAPNLPAPILGELNKTLNLPR